MRKESNISYEFMYMENLLPERNKIKKWSIINFRMIHPSRPINKMKKKKNKKEKKPI